MRSACVTVRALRMWSSVLLLVFVLMQEMALVSCLVLVSSSGGDYEASIGAISGAADLSSTIDAEAPVVNDDGSVSFRGQEEGMSVDSSQPDGVAATTTTVSPYQTVPVALNYTVSGFEPALKNIVIDVQSSVQKILDSSSNIKTIRRYVSTQQQQQQQQQFSQ